MSLGGAKPMDEGLEVFLKAWRKELKDDAETNQEKDFLTHKRCPNIPEEEGELPPLKQRKAELGNSQANPLFVLPSVDSPSNASSQVVKGKEIATDDGETSKQLINQLISDLVSA